MYDRLKRFEQMIFDSCSIFLVLFYSYSAVVQRAATQYHRGVYIMITYVLVFLLYQSRNKWMRVVDYILILLSVVSVGYWVVNLEAINYRMGNENIWDKAIAIIGVLVGIELARRVVGAVFVIMGVLMLLYGVYGAYMPDLFSHAGDTFPDLCTSIFYKSDGVFGIMANVLATYVVLFILFGAFLEKCGAQKFFIDFPLAAVGHKVGGPAKVSVIASGLFGSISGSAIANTVSTGAFTIPMMKKAGFKPHIAGGIEPAASIGGMFMPPIMGAGGFIMAEMTGVPYSRIMLIAIFPALMYFFSVFVMVHYEAKKYHIAGEKYERGALDILKSEWIYIMPLIIITVFMLSGYSPDYSAILGLATCILVSYKDSHTRIDMTLTIIMIAVLAGSAVVAIAGKLYLLEIPVMGCLAFLALFILFPIVIFQTTGRRRLFLVISGVVLLGAGCIFIISAARGIEPSMEAKLFFRDLARIFAKPRLIMVGLFAVLVYNWYRRDSRENTRAQLVRFAEAARAGVESSLKIGATVGVIGIIIGVLTYSGLVLTFADIVIELAEGSLILTILLIALASLVLGMGVPVTAAYLITAVVAVPALTHLGVNEIAAHMIVYWLSQDSNITPPVCIAAFAGATIANANMWRTAFASFKFAKFLYLGPFLFGYVPAFSLDGSHMDIVKAFILIIFGTWLYSWFLSGIWIQPLRKFFGGAANAA
ncbi:MAG: C4-dicarboxylate ABC transporter permease [Desulfobacterales bacterium]|nr:MAG: C4-dicarboxylate ABC transporter permease [Desulfobacterales bacterium]